jgi:NAD(P)-dependent dehydrogenase (short-subunit alcohol dehydrogenase family)
MRLKDRMAIVTGAGRGIGQGIATALAEDGAEVIITDIDTAAAAEAAEDLRSRGFAAHSAQLDVTNPAQIESVLPRLSREHGGLKILVNNAGGLTAPDGHMLDRGTILDVPLEDWDAIVDINLKATFLMCRVAIPLMLENGGGSIINVASAAALMVLRSGSGTYAAAKAGLIQLTRSIAVDFGPLGIRANSICPGGIETRSPEERGFASPRGDDVKRRQVSMQRVGRPIEVGRVVAFLASDEASFINAANHLVEGGMVGVEPLRD